MYIPKRYNHDNQDEILEFIQANSFGSLISSVNNRPWATHIPFMVKTNENGMMIHAHMSRANEQWKSLEGQEILIVFQGPHAYISSSWYDHEEVPTWNYTAVHVYGKVKLLNSDQTYNSVKELVDYYEKGREGKITMEGLSEKNLAQLSGIVAFEIEVSEVQAKRKLSQNHNAKNKQAVIDQLEKSNDSDSKGVAKDMRDSE